MSSHSFQPAMPLGRVCSQCGERESHANHAAVDTDRAQRMLAAINAYQRANSRTLLGSGPTEDAEILWVIRKTLDQFSLEDTVHMAQQGASWLDPRDTDKLAEAIDQGIRQFGDVPLHIASHVIITLGAVIITLGAGE